MSEPQLLFKLPFEVWAIVFREIYRSTYKQLLKNLNLCVPKPDDVHTNEPFIYSYSCWQRYIVDFKTFTDLPLNERYYLACRVNTIVKKLYAKDLTLQDALKINHQINLLKALLHKTHVFHKKFTYRIIGDKNVLTEISTYYFWDEKRGKRFQEF